MTLAFDIHLFGLGLNALMVELTTTLEIDPNTPLLMLLSDCFLEM